MKSDIQITVYYGPLSWFKQKLPSVDQKSLLEIVIERDEASRVYKHRIDGQKPLLEPEDAVRPPHVVAESSDYASLNEHVITNFAGLVRSINPKHIYLHNPPVTIQTQLERAFGLTKENVKRYVYPVVTRKTLTDIHEGFSSHLVGQDLVREQILSALYPLTSPNRTKPVTIMLYGPSGVGKTETAQFVNGLLGGKLMRKQFSMFQNEKFAFYLFGGHHNEASFAHDLLDRESGVILIDEFDKANPIFHSAFYQLFDEGVFEDRNYHLQLGPSLIICTSNYESEKQIREALGDALYSRFDALIHYENLESAHVVQIIDRIFDHKVSLLSEDERQKLDQNTLRAGLHRLAMNGGNVRKIDKQVEEVISLCLVRSILKEKR